MSARVLVLNAGSSSLKYSLVDAENGTAEASGSVERIGEDATTLTHRGPGGTHRDDGCAAGSAQEALAAALGAFEQHGPDLGDPRLVAVGHRVVHGGSRFTEPTLVDDAVLREIADLVPLAPLHNPANLEGLRVARDRFPDVPQVAVFDTAFHQTMPPAAYTYAVPLAWREEHQVRRYGFHGTSHAYVSRAAAAMLGRRPEETNLVVLHLGNGSSATAVRGGRSVDTSMGLTPLEGLVMGTRSGDVDPAVFAHLRRRTGWSVEEIDRVLTTGSGLKGLTGSNDFRDLVRRRAEGDADAVLAFDVYAHRVRKYIGAYYAVLGTVHAVVLTGGVGQHSADLRSAALSGLEGLGIRLDPARNDRITSEPAVVSAVGSPVAVLVVPTDEEGEIARQALDVVRDPATRPGG